jgi:acyl carrier protein
MIMQAKASNPMYGTPKSGCTYRRRTFLWPGQPGSPVQLSGRKKHSGIATDVHEVFDPSTTPEVTPSVAFAEQVAAMERRIEVNCETQLDAMEHRVLSQLSGRKKHIPSGLATDVHEGFLSSATPVVTSSVGFAEQVAAMERRIEVNCETQLAGMEHRVLSAIAELLPAGLPSRLYYPTEQQLTDSSFTGSSDASSELATATKVAAPAAPVEIAVGDNVETPLAEGRTGPSFDETVALMVAELSDYAMAEKIDTTATLNELGFDSVANVELAMRFADLFGPQLDLMSMMNNSIEDVARVVVRDQGRQQAVVSQTARVAPPITAPTPSAPVTAAKARLAPTNAVASTAAPSAPRTPSPDAQPTVAPTAMATPNPLPSITPAPAPAAPLPSAAAFPGLPLGAHLGGGHLQVGSAPTAVAALSAAAETYRHTFRVLPTFVNVRAGPSVKARILARRFEGETFEAVEERNGWVCEGARADGKTPGWLLVDGTSLGLGVLLEPVATGVAPPTAAQSPSAPVH